MYEVEVFTRFAGLGKKLEPVDVIQARGSGLRECTWQDVITQLMMQTLGSFWRFYSDFDVFGWSSLGKLKDKHTTVICGSLDHEKVTFSDGAWANLGIQVPLHMVSHRNRSLWKC